MNIKYISKGFGLIALCLIFSKESQAKLNFSILDSIGVENSNNKQVVLHRLEAKESYYSLSRKYAIQPKDIIAFNNNKSLRIGDVIKIPTNRPFSSSPKSNTTVQANSAPPASNSKNVNSRAENTQNTNSTDNGQNTQYRVSAGETLYTIAKRFQVSVNQIVKTNNLKNEQDIK